MPSTTNLTSTPIVCEFCGKESGYTKEGLMFYVIHFDLQCKHCGRTIIYASNIVC